MVSHPVEMYIEVAHCYGMVLPSSGMDEQDDSIRIWTLAISRGFVTLKQTYWYKAQLQRNSTPDSRKVSPDLLQAKIVDETVGLSEEGPKSPELLLFRDLVLLRRSRYRLRH